jgi:TatA/E family protein of Tat protein translocase
MLDSNMPGFSDLILILMVALFIFGAGKLPAIATAIGKSFVRLRSKTDEDVPK